MTAASIAEIVAAEHAAAHIPPGMETIPVMRENVSWIMRLSDATKRGASKIWGWLTSAANWAIDRTIEAYHWSKDKVVRGSRWTWDKAKIGGSTAKRWGANSWYWTKDMGARAWFYVRPALRWTSTPVRVTLATIFGAAWVAAFGPTVLVAGVVGWLAYFLFTGRTGRAPAEGRFQSPNLAVTETEVSAITKRIVEVTMQKSATEDVAQASNLSGRLFILTRALEGAFLTPSDAMLELRQKMDEHHDPDEVDTLDYTAVMRGMKAEYRMIKKIFAGAPHTRPAPPETSLV